MSNVPELRFPEFEGEWEAEKLGEIGEVLMCKRIFADQTNENEGVPFYKIGTLGGKPDAFISNLLFEEYKSKYNYPRIGEILITCSGTVGKCLPYNGQNAYYQDSNIVWIDNSTKKIINKLLLSILQNVNWGKLNSTTITRIYISDLRDLVIAFPKEKTEQQKIADFLTLIDKKITKQDEKVAALEQYKKGLMQKIFSREIRFKDDNGKDYPEWEAKLLNDMVSFARGFGLSKSSIAANGFKECILYGELFTEYSAIINKVKSKTNSTSGFISQTNDVLMPTSDVTPRGLCKASCLLKDGVLLGGDINILRPKFNFSGTFISYIINALPIKILEKVTGTTVKHIYTKDIKNIIYSVPCLLEQTKIANFLSLYDRKIEKEKAKLEALKVQKKGLLQQMFV